MGQILVPFPVESALSGVQRTVGPNERLWYHRVVRIPESWSKQKVILHFEAVDWEATVFIDGQEVGRHRGGYDPFSFDISEFVRAGSEHDIRISVWDPTNSGDTSLFSGVYFNPRGKQVAEPGGIFYTATTGIWQTVWLEPVPKTYITEFQVTPDVDSESASFLVHSNGATDDLSVRITVYLNSEVVARSESAIEQSIHIKIPNAQLWSAINPVLYDVELELIDRMSGMVIDSISSYFGMRKVSLGKDEHGFTRIMLNNEFVFQNGPLDQGFWPDGIYTPPTDEALRFDLEMTKAMGFNMLRKHVKIESRRFYYHCDRIGLWVWQDMPSAQPYIGPEDDDLVVDQPHREQFELELGRMINSHFNHPSIIMWIPFNEGWGQFSSAEIAEMVKLIDPTRLVNIASGWANRPGVGDVYDIHHYPEPRMPVLDEGRAGVLGEFGGLGYAVENHLWAEGSWGYRSFQEREELAYRYQEFYSTVFDFVERGLSAAVYTQTTDVETEVNGLMTYDRQVVKLDTTFLRQTNMDDFVPMPRIHNRERIFNEPFDVEITHRKAAAIYYTLNDSIPDEKSLRYIEPVTIEGSSTLKAIAIDERGRQSAVVTRQWEKTDMLTPAYTFPYSEKYNAGGQFGLIDGKSGSENFMDGRWQGFEENDFEAVFQIPTGQVVGKVSVNFLQNQGVWIFLPSRVEVLASHDGEDFNKVHEMNFDVAADSTIKIEQVSADLPQYTKYVKIRARNLARCPEWHQAAGGKCWIFVDEVIMK